MSRYGTCKFCGAVVLGWHSTDGFHPSAHFCEPMVDSLQSELARLRTDRDRLRRALTEALYAIDNYDGEPIGAIASILDDAIYDAALTQREGGENGTE